MAKQIPLDLGHKTSFNAADFLRLPCNDDAMEHLLNWPNWGAHAMALVGPSGSGKSHLAMVWAEKAGAIVWQEDSDIVSLGEGVAIVVDDADSTSVTDEALFHMYNWTKETRGSLLLTGQKAPNLWDKKLPDLVSRLATLPVAEIGMPDEQTLEIVLLKQLSDRQLSMDIKVISYLITHMNRSFEDIRLIVDAVDKLSLAKKNKITIPIVKDVMKAMEKNSIGYAEDIL